MKCPSCGSRDQDGTFCGECGAALRATCPACGAATMPGGRFCTRCGERIGASGAGSLLRGPGRAGWVIAAIALTVVVLILFLPGRADRAGPPGMTTPVQQPGPGASGGPGGTGVPGALSGDMRTNADRLFARIMTAAQAGDDAEVARFMPMAVQAYELVEELDADGLYHLALLHRTAGDHAEAIATAERILEGSPDHILALGVAGEAASAMGDASRASSYYRRLLDAYPEEAARPRPEYSDHQPMLPAYRRAATEYLGAD